MKIYYTFPCLFIILAFSTLSSLNAQTNNNINLQQFKKADYDILNNSNLFKEIDFYNANEITLYRELRGNEVIATNGVLKIINNIRYEYVILPKLNIGRYYTTIGYSNFRISFDARHPEKSMLFYMDKSDNGDDLFYLSTKIIGNQNTVSYDGKTYYVLTGPGFSKDGTNYVYLLYNNTREANKATKLDTLQSFPSRKGN